MDEIDPLSLKKERLSSMMSPREGSERQMRKDYEAGRISSFGRKGQSVGWTDFGDSFGFGEMPKMRGSVRPQGSGPVSSYFSSQEEKIKTASENASDLQAGDSERAAVQKERMEKAASEVGIYEPELSKIDSALDQ